MYRTSTGVRTLTGSEARLFREGLGAVTVMVEDAPPEEPFSSGVRVFDTLSRGQKLVMLNRVGRALLLEPEPVPPLTAVVEGTVAAVFQYLSDALVMEIEDPELGRSGTWRELVLGACREHGFEELPNRRSRDLSEWDLQLTCLRDTIFFDADWEVVDQFLDGDVGQGRELKTTLGIDDGYFVDAPLEPTPKELKRILVSLRSLFVPA